MLGQLFCDGKAQAILNMLLLECHRVNAEISLNVTIERIEKLADNHFKVISTSGIYHCQSLVIASGGLSIPTMGASPFGYHVATQFNIPVWPTRAGLVPFTLQPADLEKFSVLSGVSINCVAQNDLLFTHRGLSGPAILQLSSYWKTNETVRINMLPNVNVFELLKVATQTEGQKQLKSILTTYLPKRIVETCIVAEYLERKVATFSHRQLKIIADQINHWLIKPNGTEGYRTAEVTLGGVDCDALSSKTMEALHCKGLYFIGEVVDVTGWLGGYNFQWAWSSGFAAGQVV
jgi:predicted Rossmann fold flavoprotein